MNVQVTITVKMTRLNMSSLHVKHVSINHTCHHKNSACKCTVFKNASKLQVSSCQSYLVFSYVITEQDNTDDEAFEPAGATASSSSSH